MTAKKFHIHLVSDASGETVSSAARACLVQFEDIEPIYHSWWLIRTQGQIARVVAGIEANPGVVLATLLESPIRASLEEACRSLGVPCIPLLDPVMKALSDHLNVNFEKVPGRQHALDAEYFKRIEAMQYTLAHDDGQLMDDIEDADVILLGVSRTSKTPTCMYLANRGLKAANIPLVPGIPLPPEIFQAKKPLIIGLTKEPKSLSDIRKTRLKFLNEDNETDYADVDKVKEEVLEARRLCTRNKWPIIDVSHRSIEEASAEILQFYWKHVEKMKHNASQNP